MKVVIIEDEKIAADNLEYMLKQVDPGIQIMGKIDSVKKAVQWLQENKPELIFLDIHLADGNSFSIFNEIEISTPIIFTTAYDQYSLKAFKVNSVDYLLKPIDQEELSMSVEKFKRLANQPNNSADISSLLQILGVKKEYKSRFLIQYAEKAKSIPTTAIAYFYVLEKSTFLCTFEKQSFPVDMSLDKLEMLIDPEIFFRINRQTIVNFNAIDNMVTLSKSRMMLELKPKPMFDTLVSFNRMSDFRKWLNK